VIYYC